MAGEVLEREGPLAVLRDALSAAVAGHGSVALVTGEAGIGKTSLVRAFAAGAPDAIRVRHDRVRGGAGRAVAPGHLVGGGGRQQLALARRVQDAAVAVAAHDEPVERLARAERRDGPQPRRRGRLAAQVGDRAPGQRAAVSQGEFEGGVHPPDRPRCPGRRASATVAQFGRRRLPKLRAS
jgi:hypothetical protein